MMIKRCLLALLSGLLMSACSRTGNATQSQTQGPAGGTSHKTVHIDWHAELVDRQKQLERDPNSAFLHNQVAVAYDALGDFDSFDREIQTAIKLDPGNTIDCYVAYAVYKRRHLDEKALSVLDKALKIDPENPFGHFERGRIFETSKERQNALTEYKATQHLLGKITSNAQNFQQGRWYYTDPRGNPYDVTPQEASIGSDIVRVQGGISRP